MSHSMDDPYSWCTYELVARVRAWLRKNSRNSEMVALHDETVALLQSEKIDGRTFIEPMLPIDEVYDKFKLKTMKRVNDYHLMVRAFGKSSVMKSVTIVVSKTGEATEIPGFRLLHKVATELQILEDECKIHLTDSDAASIKATELLIRCMANTKLPDEFYSLPIDEVWRVLTLVDITALNYIRQGKYNVPCSVLLDWFKGWFHRNHSGFTKRQQYELLLFPAFVFGSGYFRTITQWLVWNVAGQIQDRNPFMEDENLSLSYADMRLPKDLIHAIENSQVALKNNILKLLDEFPERFMEAPRPSRIQCWMHFTDSELEPVKDILMSYSVNETLEAIRIIFGPISMKDFDDCYTCRTIIKIRRQVFHGLCLSCIRLSMNESEKHLEAKYGDFKSKLMGKMICEHDMGFEQKVFF
ncbi:hypothetical protein F4679DRAFT_595558 [Xylaria curta]|nr:hypothetical protein F4679DRAFT_595558 [Xylaria curta]